jgi:predicted O-methyltransferase YrrM
VKLPLTLRSWLLAKRAIRRGALQKPAELRRLLATVEAESPRVVLEIGTCSGGTLWALCRVAAPDARIVSVDLPGGPSSGGTVVEPTVLGTYVLPTQRSHFFRGDSHRPEIREAVRETLTSAGPVDLLMIDGDHTYDGVKQDFEDYAPFVRDGGLIVFHDILHHPKVPACQVDRFWQEIRARYHHVEYCQPRHDAGWGQWGGIGVLRWTAGGNA